MDFIHNSQQIQEIADQLDISTYIDENNVIWLCGKDLKVTAHMRSCYSKCKKEHKKTIRKDTLGGMQEMTFLTLDACKAIICKSRSTRSIELASAFGIPMLQKNIPIETETLSFIMRVFKGKNMVCQYYVEPYRIDLYFPDSKLAIECDEKDSHSSIKQIQSDAARQKYIEKVLDCRFVRYMPHNFDFSMADLINNIICALGCIPEKVI